MQRMPEMGHRLHRGQESRSDLQLKVDVDGGFVSVRCPDRKGRSQRPLVHLPFRPR